MSRAATREIWKYRITIINIFIRLSKIIYTDGPAPSVSTFTNRLSTINRHPTSNNQQLLTIQLLVLMHLQHLRHIRLFGLRRDTL